ncbi:MAG: hypothetical protein FWF67_00770 [Fibromonadales bacterium]|nr:hypothetical protein [Fibromonadales bacterium]
MKPYFHKFAYVAGIVLALALTFSCSSDDGGDSPGETYELVIVGNQIWTKKNLNYDVPDDTTDVCYNDSDTINCPKYGRLYSWATAMALPSKCNSVLSTSDADCAIKTPHHKGICLAGWHIPSNADWDKLYRFMDNSTSTNSPYESTTSGRLLKAKEGWANCGPANSGKTYQCDDTGFTALPGGKGRDDGIFEGAGRLGYWWTSSSDEAGTAYLRSMENNSNDARWHNNSKSWLLSVRCVKDNSSL